MLYTFNERDIMTDLEFRPARAEDADRIYSLYKSVVGDEHCVWSEDYPDMREIRHDTETENLYLLTEGGKLIGAISILPENELDPAGAWEICGSHCREIARVVISKDFRGRALALDMVNKIAEKLSARGVLAIHLAVEKNNLPAVKTYLKAGFTTVGAADMYGHSYLLMEKLLATVHKMKLKPEPFRLMSCGSKTIELRLLDEKRERIRVSDIIEFACTDGGEKITAKVTALHKFASFEELYAALPVSKFGYNEDELAAASAADMEAYYSRDEQKKYGVVGIELFLLK